MHHNRRKLITAALAALTLAGALPVIAQDSGRASGGSRLDYLAGYLSLTDAQKAQAKTIFDGASTASATVQGQSTAARAALKAAIKANATDSELDRLAAAIGVIHGQSEAIQAKASTKFYALLTAEQKTKYDALGDRQGGAGRNNQRSRRF